MGLLYERRCGHCIYEEYAITVGKCKATDHTVQYYDDDLYAESCPYYKNRYGFHESGIKEEHIIEFQKCCQNLNILIEKIRKYCPEAQYYLATSNLHLMIGASHELSGKPRSEYSVTSEIISHISGGDW